MCPTLAAIHGRSTVGPGTTRSETIVEAHIVPRERACVTETYRMMHGSSGLGSIRNKVFTHDWSTCTDHGAETDLDTCGEGGRASCGCAGSGVRAVLRL